MSDQNRADLCYYCRPTVYSNALQYTNRDNGFGHCGQTPMRHPTENRRLRRAV